MGLNDTNTCLAEAKRHWDAGRGVIAFFTDKGSRKPIMSAKTNDREAIYLQSCLALKKNPEKYYLALICGEESDLSMIDIDCKQKPDGTYKNGLETWQAMAAERNNSEGLEQAVCAGSPSGGLHFYFRYTPELSHGQEKCFKTRDGSAWADIDIRNKQTCGFGICAPSPGYKWIRSPFDYPLTTCPQWIIDWHKQSQSPGLASPPRNVKNRNPPKRRKKSDMTTLDTLRSLVMSIPVEHSSEYDAWYKILMAIHRVSHENEYAEEGLELAHEFSRQCPSKYDEEALNTKWKSFDPNGQMGLGTLVFYSKNNYAAVKAEFEKTAFKVIHPLQYCIKKDGADIWSYSRQDFISVFQNKYFLNNDGKQCSFIHAWLADSELRAYDEIVFDPPPTTQNKNNYNLYSGLRAENLRDSEACSIEAILAHMKIMTDHDEEGFHYFQKWSAQRVQFPGLRPKTAMIFQGKQGCGKGVFWEWFGEKLLGKQYYFGTAGMRDLTGHFNEGLMNRLLIFLDETKTRDSFKEAAELKRLIDAPHLKVNKKYSALLELRNCAGWVFASNEALPVNVEPGDRRFVIFRCSSEKKGDMEYFRKLVLAMEDDRVTRAFYNHLMSIDLSKFHPERDRPRTQAYEDMKEASAPADVAFVEWLMTDDEADIRPKEWIQASELETLFRQFKKQNNLPEELLSLKRFGLAMKEWLPWKRASQGVFYRFDEDIARERLVAAGYKWFQKDS